MPSAENAILYYEADQTDVAMTELTDQGDHKEFKSSSQLWSNKSGKEPDVKPNGLATGGVVTPAASLTNDLFDVSAITCYQSGVKFTISADTDVAIVRPVVSNYQKFSVTINASQAIAVVDGAEGTSFSDTRGANGGPPWIPLNSIEIAQIWISSQTPALILASEIKQVQGQTIEFFHYPNWLVVHSDVENGQLGYAGINFYSAAQLIHSADAGVTQYTKKVFASWSVPIFAEVVDAYDFVPPNNAHTVSSKPVYGRTKGARSASLNQGSFSVDLTDGITDSILDEIDNFIWFKFKQDRLKDPYILAQGKLGITQTFPAGDSIVGNCVISPDVVSQRIKVV